MRLKIYGCGSIGNHMAHAARTLGWHVDMVDIDENAIIRAKNIIYPSRYGSWDAKISLFIKGKEPKGGYDLIHIGTPPLSHVPLALECLEETPNGILVEKPLCEPAMKNVQRLVESSKRLKIPVFTGYDHVVGQAAEKCSELLKENVLGPIETLDVEFREFWGGIFQAHPWLKGPEESYLGYWERGGGAGGEHSHAINLWQHFAKMAGRGRVALVSAIMDYHRDEQVNYDKLCLLHLHTEEGLIGRVVQDVVTTPPRKWARIQGREGYLEWHCGAPVGMDVVLMGRKNGALEKFEFPKTRPDDFVRELRHIEYHIRKKNSESPLSIQSGVETMELVAAAHRSSQTGESCEIGGRKIKKKS